MPKVWGEEYRTTFVCVDSYEHGVLRGRFYNPYTGNGQSFESLTDFLVKTEQMLDEMEFPKAFTVTRTFTMPPKRPACAADAHCEQGKRATFALRILFRQNASWQGSVTWIENKQEQSFRSVLELIFLFDNALNQSASADEPA